jgi:hypothetical protein
MWTDVSVSYNIIQRMRHIPKALPLLHLSPSVSIPGKSSILLVHDCLPYWLAYQFLCCHCSAVCVGCSLTIFSLVRIN